MEELVRKMEKNDFELQNKNHNTALYLAAAAGNYVVILFIYLCSCFIFPSQSDCRIFSDVALQIVKDHPELASSGSVLGVLTRKPDAFSETKCNIIRRIINSGTHQFSYSLMFITQYT